MLLRALSFNSAPFIFNNWYILQFAVDLQDQYPCFFSTKQFFIINSLIRRLQGTNATCSLTSSLLLKFMKIKSCCYSTESPLSPRPSPKPGPHPDHSQVLQHRTANHLISCSCLRIYVMFHDSYSMCESNHWNGSHAFLPPSFNLNLRAKGRQIRLFCLLCKYSVKYSILVLIFCWSLAEMLAVKIQSVLKV